MSNVIAIRKATSLAALGSGPSVLGEAQARIPIGGKVRAGIKVLTAAAAKHPKAPDIYRRGVQAGQTWDEIEKALKETCGFDRSPMTPRNVPYFTVRRADFAVPEVADRILEVYGEDRGDGRRLYRFPVILPLETWLGNMPHGLKAFTKSELVYWSDYGPDGSRYCYTRGTVEMDPRAKRARRVFGGRPTVLRPDNGGHCDPNACPEYQAGKCKLSGGMVFYIPGIPGSSAIQLPTTSFYSLSQWRQQMEMVAFLRGRLSGTGPNGRPIFWLAKREPEVSMIDPETGRAKRVKQFLVALEADIDMGQVFNEDHAPALTGPEAVSMLEVEAIEGDVLPSEDPKAEIKALRAEVYAALQTLGIEAEQFAAYAARSWGEAWGKDMEALRLASRELDLAQDDLPGYLRHIAGVVTEDEVPF